jgi:chromodomain-helicase-DNA-binding protein 1
MSTSPEPSPANGHLSPVADEVTVNTFNGDQSDSDLSEVQAVDVDERARDYLDGLNGPRDTKIEDESDDPSEGSQNDGSDDADYDMAESVASPRSIQEADIPSSSNSSQRPAKRRAPAIVEDDYIRNDPELYGLRRSVWQSSAPILWLPTHVFHSPGPLNGRKL